MLPIPRDPLVEATLAMRRDPYRYLSRRARALDTDLFQTRLLLRPTLCMTGRDAARLFYDPRCFVRRGASPPALQKTLFGRGGVQGLDGAAHAHRKRLFLSVTKPPSRVESLVDGCAGQWRRAATLWRGRGEVDLYGAAQETLTRAVCEWAGIALAEDEVGRRTRDLVALFDGAGSFGPRHLRARWARHRSERWAARLVEGVRSGPRSDGESVLDVIALHRDPDGRLLDPEVASVELLNVLRPTVAISVSAVFLAHALHRHPEYREKLRSAPVDDLRAFVHEVRRFYPFFPAVPAIVREDFEWRGHRLRAGMRALLDLYGTDHDARVWTVPDEFRPERFRGREIGPFDLVPQGGGDHERDHRCAGEWITIGVMVGALRFLVEEIDYDVAPRSLELDMSRLPALPSGGLVLQRVVGRG